VGGTEGLGLLFLVVAFGTIGGVLGRLKGSSFWTWFLISGCPPFLGLLAALFYRYENEELRRQCPGCGKVLKLYDAVCMGCGTELEFPDVAIAPQATIRRRKLAARRAATAGVPEPQPPSPQG
jgi:hypothetical protein